MKLFVIAFAIITAVAADASHLPSTEYLPPVPEASAPSAEYLPPVASDAAPAHDLSADGYRYKTNRRVVYRRNRRDASHVPSSEYLPPNQEASVPSTEYLPPVAAASSAVEVAPAHDLAADGYRYKTNRRVVYRRNRRDASHVPSNEYLPPNPEASAPSPDYLAPAPEAAPAVEAAPAHELAADGYRYKTNRRVVYRRNRRDASHVPSNEYLPPNPEASAPSADYLAPAPEAAPAVEAAPAHELAADGYRYKTNRRVVYRRNRRDASHVPSNEYLPPNPEASAPSADYLAPAPEAAPAVEAAPAHELAADGYRYKTNRRVVYRRH